jgi:hypothetical protein
MITKNCGFSTIVFTTIIVIKSIYIITIITILIYYSILKLIFNILSINNKNKYLYYLFLNNKINNYV